MTAPPSLQELRQKLALLDFEIDDTHTKLSDLLAARKRVVAELKNIAYPQILELPQELTEEIFVHAVWYSNPDSWLPQASPVVLASVCRAWRRIALALSSIWCKIDITSGYPSALLRLFLSRAAQRPLEVFFDQVAEKDAERIMRVFGESVSRWADFTWNAVDDSDAGLTVALENFSGSLTRLKALTLVGFLADEGSPVTVFSAAPALREVCLDHVYAHQVDLPLEQLTKLRCNGLDALSTFHFLERAVNVEDLTLHVEDTGNIHRSEPLILSRARRLCFIYDGSGSHDVADALVLPALQDLHVVFSGRDRHAEAARIIRLLVASKCEIPSLSLQGPTTDCVSGILERTPTLTTLKIQDFVGQYPGRLLSHSMALVKNLRTLRVQMTAATLPYTDVLEMAYALKSQDREASLPVLEHPEDAPPLQLSEVYFSATPTLSEADAETLAEMTADDWPSVGGRVCDFSIIGPQNMGIQSRRHPVGSLSRRLEKPYVI
ncbi:F-box domain-containing protein [Mycena kentingensis (nom. inval.)]|nr:F-box domain-containing protein [Mycena kentingensis (nom. inval.)]